MKEKNEGDRTNRDAVLSNATGSSKASQAETEQREIGGNVDSRRRFIDTLSEFRTHGDSAREWQVLPATANASAITR
jgi:hypothetical protein